MLSISTAELASSSLTSRQRTQLNVLLADLLCPAYTGTLGVLARLTCVASSPIATLRCVAPLETLNVDVSSKQSDRVVYFADRAGLFPPHLAVLQI